MTKMPMGMCALPLWRPRVSHCPVSPCILIMGWEKAFKIAVIINTGIWFPTLLIFEKEKKKGILSRQEDHRWPDWQFDGYDIWQQSFYSSNSVTSCGLSICIPRIQRLPEPVSICFWSFVVHYILGIWHRLLWIMNSERIFLGHIKNSMNLWK